MRPHRLELQAFGAFPQRVDLDLDALGQNGLLLLCGDTGGGKTTLLDAIGFALYGVVPGERQKARDELRSHHAAETDRTYVRLEFTARARRLRVTRTPEQVRPAKRGGGTTKEQASALLEQWTDGQWQPVAQRLDEVGLEVARLVGMDATQFFQVVLLPQGRFAAFLHADHKDREKLLKRLFHVETFEHVERWLAERAQQSSARLDQARQRLLTVSARVAQQADVDAPDDVAADETWAQRVAVEAAQVRDALATVTAARLAERQRAEADLESCVDLARRQQERRDAEHQRSELQAQAGQMAELAGELDAAVRAVPVAVALTAATARAGELVERQRQEELARADVAAAGGPRDAGVQELRELARSARTETGRLEALRDVLERAEAAERAALDARRTAEQARDEAQQLDERLSGPVVEEQAQEQARLSRAREAARALPEQRAALEVARAQELRAAQAVQAAAAAEALHEQAEQARARSVEAARHVRELRIQRVDAMAAELAAALVDGGECPVCGALEHPAPAEVRTDHVTRAQESEAEQAATAAAAEAAEVQAQAAVAAERAALLADAGAAPLDVAQRAARVAELEEFAADEARAEARVHALAAEAEQLRRTVLTLQLQSADAERRAEELTVQAQADAAKVTAALAGDVDLSARLARTSRLADAADAAAAAVEATQAAGAAADDADRTAADLASAAGFADATAAGDVVRDEQWRESAQARLSEHRERLVAVESRLADPDLAVPLDPPAPVAAAQDRAKATAVAHEEALASERVAADRAARLDALVAEWCAAFAAVPPLRDEVTEVKGLAELAAGRGGNAKSMPLSTFVLAARLEQVAAAASLRLARMTDGRYTLVHTDAQRDRRTRAGLGLQVADSWTGRVRDTATLSGGETFMTALSLALGLADVVTAEAGGQTIDALFVDEGFGSLDAGTLDTVMDVLDDLRSGGRLVGLVSHVADLRLRIPTQIVVDKGSSGSVVRTTSAAA